MSDRAVFVLAAAAALGAWSGSGPPVVVGGALVVAAWLARRPWALCIAVLLLAGGRGAADADGLHAARIGPFRGWVELAGDPVAGPGGAVVVDARVGGDRAELTARGEAALVLRARAAGDVVLVGGERRRAPPNASWLARRHVALRMAITEAGPWRDGWPPWRVANAARDAIARSAVALPARQRGLYLGLVLGDEREEPADIADDFRGAGLAHLLAVSGQNVALVLALAGPLLRRSGFRTRLALTIAVLAVFVLTTRAEPSVLRASAMAGIAAVAAALGREASGLRTLTLAVAGLLVADPFLVGSVGFQLSVAASAAILVAARPIAARLPGPRPIAEVVGVSVAAQGGVAPVLAATFGSVPVVGLLANVLAAPAAGPVMAWGVAAGLVGGVVGPAASGVLHLPTRLLVGWLALVARWSAQLPLGELGPRELIAVAVGMAVLAGGRRFGLRWLVPAGAALLVGALIAPALALRGPRPAVTVLGRGATLWSDGGTLLVLDGRSRVDDVLAGLRRSGVGRLDLVVVSTSGTRAAAVVDAVAARSAVGAVLDPGAVPTVEQRRVGRLVVTLTPASTGLAVAVARDSVP